MLQEETVIKPKHVSLSPKVEATEVGDYKKAVKSDDVAIEISIWNDRFEDIRGKVAKEIWNKSLDMLRHFMLLPY
eukprot:7932-Ditylum_brightwellii.AAC.1